MGLTQHAHGVPTIQALINVGLLRGWVGRAGTGLMPIRGHSGVQGGAEVGCTPVLAPADAQRCADVWGFALPEFEGYTASEMVDAAWRGGLDVFWTVGGNFLETLPDPPAAARALGRVGTRIHQRVVHAHLSCGALDNQHQAVVHAEFLASGIQGGHMPGAHLTCGNDS